MLHGRGPLFRQVADAVEDSILSGALVAGERAPSTNELVAFYRINPATAAKGIGVLVDRGILAKRRGVGMFVAQGALEQLRGERREALLEEHVDPLLRAAAPLGLSGEETARLVRDRSRSLPDAVPPSFVAPTRPEAGPEAGRR